MYMFAGAQQNRNKLRTKNYKIKNHHVLSIEGVSSTLCKYMVHIAGGNAQQYIRRQIIDETNLNYYHEGIQHH
jgi:hypothetical protein